MRTTGTRTHHNWPALYTAFLLTAGILAGYHGNMPFLSAPCTVTVLMLSSLALLVTAIWIPAGDAPALSLAGLATLVATGGVLGSDLHASSPPLLEEHACVPVTVIGTVLDPPSRAGGALRFRCALRAILTDSALQESDETAMVSLRDGREEDGLALPDYGMTVALHGDLMTPRGVRNPGEFNAREFYRANGVTLLLTVKGRRHACVLRPEGGSWWMRQLVLSARKHLLAHIDNRVGGEAGEFLKGLMIGERGGLTPELRDAFLVAGVAHILAVSGSNVAVVATAVVALLLLLRIPRRAHAPLVACVLLFYMLLTGSQPSVVRATIMGMIALVVSRRGVRGNPLNAIGIATLLMYGIDPRQLFDAGFQLSFAAVLSIVALYPRLNVLISAWKGTRWHCRLIRGGLRLGAVSLVASAGTFPLTAASFGQVSLIGLLANVFVVPVSGWSVVLGLLSAGIDVVSSAAAESLCALNALALSLTLHAVRLCASAPFASVPTHWFTAVDTLPFLGLLGLAYHAGNASFFRDWCVLTLCAGNVAVYAPQGSTAPEGLLRVTVLDVGQGDAILIQHPDGGTVLIDTGPPPADARSGLVPYLLRSGITSPEVVLITHAHDDHAGGLALLRSSLHVQRLITYATAEAGMLIPWRNDCRLQVLCADPGNAGAGTSAHNANRSSVVVRLVFGETAFLFAADAERPEEERMVAAYADGLRSAVLKIGHHGSPSATTAAWLDAVRPSCAIISVGRGNRFGHPSDAVLRRLRERNIAVARTDGDGAVIMASDGHTVRRIQWR